MCALEVVVKEGLASWGAPGVVRAYPAIKAMTLDLGARAFLGLNLKEATQVAGVLGVNPTARPEQAVEDMVRQIREKLRLYTVVIHPRFGAAA